MTDAEKLKEANAKARVCAEFLNYVLGQGYLIVDVEALRGRAPRYGDDPDRIQGVVEMSTPLNPMRLAYDMLDLECPTSYTEDSIVTMREIYRKAAGK